jgi:hypothetical protein
MWRVESLGWVLGMAVAGFFLGCCFTPMLSGAIFGPIEPLRRTVHAPAYHVPKNPGAASLRFAMVHDVVHERFLRHGPAFYRERNKRAREALAKGKGDADALTDDLGVGLSSLGEHAEAIRIMRQKLESQKMRGLEGRALYASYANLGTFLVLQSFKGVVAGDPAAIKEWKEALALVRKSIEVNPQAHFGREEWQARLMEFLLEAVARPETLLKRDMVGNSLAEVIEGERDSFERKMFLREDNPLRDLLGRPDGELTPEERTTLRNVLTRVGPANNSAPFDEPVLGIIGMWRLGGGANPHFALALAETMLRVGQRRIAWCAFERAALLAPGFLPDAAIREKFIQHCRRRQEAIEKQLPEEEVDQLRSRFEAELAFGQRMQKEYHAYEEEQIARGEFESHVSWQTDFQKEHGEIATRPGPEELFVLEWAGWMFNESAILYRVLIPGLLVAGLFALGTALWRYWRAGAAEQAPPPGPPPATSGPASEGVV